MKKSEKKQLEIEKLLEKINITESSLSEMKKKMHKLNMEKEQLEFAELQSLMKEYNITTEEAMELIKSLQDNK